MQCKQRGSQHKEETFRRVSMEILDDARTAAMPQCAILDILEHALHKNFSYRIRQQLPSSREEPAVVRAMKETMSLHVF